jgi:ABC-type dipeptide/oligopeptide/nickel transport system permease component/ABC-type transport system substrate-binding protein
MIVLFRLLALVALLLGATASSAMATPRDTLRLALQLEPPNLDPTIGAAVATDEVAYATIFEGLVRLAADGTVEPWLATGWTVSADGRRYVFDLRGGVLFHDGSGFSADDVVFSMNRAIAPDSTNAQAQALRAISHVAALAPLRVQIDLAEPDANFLRLLSFGDAVIVSRNAIASLATIPVGTGPFRFVAWQRGDAVTLERFADYWGDAPHLRQLIFRFIADPNAAYAAMRAGDLDIFPNFPAPETLAQLADDPRLKLAIGPTEGEVILAINQRRGPLADIRVRRAIAQAIDRQAVITGAMYGYGIPIGSHFPPQDPDYIDLTGRYPHDVVAARRLLAEAGYPEGIDLTLKLPPPAYARRGGEIVAAQLGQAGIRITIRNVEWATWLDEVYKRHDFDLTLINHAEPFDYAIYGRRDYYFGYEDVGFRALLDGLKQADVATDRHRILGEIQRKLADDVVNAYLFQFPHLGVQDRALADIWLNSPNQALDFNTAHFNGPADADMAATGIGSTLGAFLWPLVWLGLACLLLRGFITFGPAYLLGRLAVLAATLLAASLVIFLLVQVAPGDPAAFMMGLNASPEAVAALHRELGLEGHAATRYLAWIGGLLQGDFGLSYTYRVPVAELIGERLPVSVPLALLATLLSLLIGVPVGILAATQQGGWLDGLLCWSMRFGLAMPSFWLAILLVLGLALGLGWLPAGGFPGWGAGVPDALAALALPVLALAVPQGAILARITRASLIAVMGRDFIRTARAKGLSQASAIRRHALPNALGPVLTVLGLQVPFLLAGGAIIENVFYLPGLGRLVLQAIAQRDLIVVQSVVVLLVGFTVLASLLVDMVSCLIDPRLRERRL